MKLHEKIEIVADHLTYETTEKDRFEEIKHLLEQLYEDPKDECDLNIEEDYEALFRADSPYHSEHRGNPNAHNTHKELI
jgi:hypothetical protein|tara:strand:+ start:7974 stop:8210 length:237 start_codon:yes stop_codon:yes gene_type:complete